MTNVLNPAVEHFLIPTVAKWMKISTIRFEFAVRVQLTVETLFRRIAAFGLGLGFRALHLIFVLWFGLGLG